MRKMLEMKRAFMIVVAVAIALSVAGCNRRRPPVAAPQPPPSVTAPPPATVTPPPIAPPQRVEDPLPVPPQPLADDSIANRSLRSEEHTSELQSLAYLVCRLLL